MRKIILVGSLLLTACTITGKDTKTILNNEVADPYGKTSYQTVFYNVENLFDMVDDPETNDEDFLPTGRLKWDNERYQKKLKHLNEALSFAGKGEALLIGLAEIENKQVVEDLIAAGSLAENYKVCHFDSPDKRGIDCALIYDSRHFKPKEQQQLVVSDPSTDFYTRDILYVSGFINGNQMIHVFVNHWPSRRQGQEESEYKRMRAAQILRKKINELQTHDPQAKIVIMGDFNDDPNNNSITSGLKAKGQTVKLNSGDLVNLMSDEMEKHEGTLVYKREWFLFDQLIVSQSMLDKTQGMYVELQQNNIVDDKKLLYIYKDGNKKPNATFGGDRYYSGYSDHLPVSLKLHL